MNYIRLQKLVRTLHKHLYTDLERYLLRNQQCFVINQKKNNSSSSDSDVFANDQIRNIQNSPYFEKFLHGALNKRKYQISSELSEFET